VPSLFPWKRLDIAERRGNPCRESSRRTSFRVDENETAEATTAQLDYRVSRPRQSFALVVFADAKHEAVGTTPGPVDAAEHVPIHEQAQAAHHSFFRDALDAVQRVAQRCA
jgi:hypothetical protein